MDHTRSRSRFITLVTAVLAVYAVVVQPANPAKAASEVGAVRVVKSEVPTPGVHRKAQGKWIFYLTGPDASANGDFEPEPGLPTVTEKTNRNGNNHKLRFNDLEAGDYRLCETFTGWKSNLGKGGNVVFLPNGDRCVDFVVAAGDTRVFRVTNTCPLVARGSG